MQTEKLKLNFKRYIALLSALILTAAFVLGGCGKVKKINPESTQPSSESSTSDSSVSSSETSLKSEATNDAGQTSAFVTAAKTQKSASANGSGSGSGSSQHYSAQKPGSTTKKGSTNGTTAQNAQTTEDYVYNDLAAQRKFGFNYGYDLATNLVLMNIANVRTYFTYGGYDWLVEFWKGEYELVTVGSEIGIYYHKNTTGKAPSNPQLLHYKAVENADALYMTMDLWQLDSKGERKVFSMPRLKYWWAAAFSQGMLEKHSRRTDLVMVASIEFKDKGMYNAFLESFKKKSFKQKSGSLTYKDADAYSTKASNNSVLFSWRYLEE